MTEPTIVSLCSGYEGLGMGVMAVLGGHLVAVADNDPGAAAILAHRFPSVPNLGDITETDWAGMGQVDALVAGFPCQDVSCAGARRGLREGTRTGVWAHVARAIETLWPSLVVLENVRGLLNAGADSDVELCPWCMGEAGDERALRASGAVLGDLADLGYDTVGAVVSAADVGAPHRRERVFILAWPAADTDRRTERPGPMETRRGLVASVASNPESGRRRDGQHADAEDPDRPTGGERRLPAPGQETGGWPRADAGGPGGALTLAHAPGQRRFGRQDLKDDGQNAGGWQQDTDHPVHRGSSSTAADAKCRTGDGGAGEPLGGPDQRTAPAGRRPAGIQWGPYGPAIRRWERTIGRPSPGPTEPGRTGERLSPRFVEWMMGLPDGWVTDVPGLSRNAQLKALGNGCVPQQVALALSLLLPYVPAEALAFLERAA